MNEVIIHKLCNYCLDKGRISFGRINVFDFNDDKLNRACEYHFKEHQIECHKDGYFSFGFFVDEDKKIMNDFYVRVDHDTNSRLVKQDKMGQKLGPK